MANQLAAGDQLTPGQQLLSTNGRYRMVLQSDGNLVEYTPDGRPLWATNTWGKPVVRATMQSDGNFVLYDRANKPWWNTKTWGRPGATIVLQDDGNFVVYDKGQPLWANHIVFPVDPSKPQDELAAFVASSLPGVWPLISKEALIADIRATVADAFNVDQGSTAFCGPAAVVFQLVQRRPSVYIKACRDLYESGRCQIGSYRVRPSDAFRASRIGSRISPADWMFIGALRDVENAIFPVTASSGPIAQGLTTPSEMVGWTGALLGLRARFTSTYVYGEFDAMRAAEDAVKHGGAAFLLIHSALVGGSEPLVGYPNHWVAYIGGLAIDTGVWWKHDSGHIKFKCYSWGRAVDVNVGEAAFEDYMYGAVIGSPS